MKTALLLFLCFACISQKLAAQGRPYVIGAIGDSISAGFNSYRLGDNRGLSWATGLDEHNLVESHAKRLREMLGQSVEVHNESFVGATSADLERQTSRLLRFKLDYVTILIGANDICNWTGNFDAEIAAFSDRLGKTVDRLTKANPSIRIVMPSIPNLMYVYEVGMANSCQARWSSIGLCQPLFGASKTPADRTKFGERFIALNNIIQGVTSRYPVNAVFKPELANYRFPREFLSAIDCFHPSVLGHNKITELTFDPSWH